jgi:hypothetical protein
MRASRLCAALLGLLLPALSLAAPGIDGSSAPSWVPCVGWVQSLPATYTVTNDGGRLVFAQSGAGREMPWSLSLGRFGVSGDERYVLVRYQATGLATPADNYFLHGEEGTYGGRRYAAADELQPDSQWHTLAVDLAAIEPQEGTRELIVKVIVDQGGVAKLTIEKLWFADELPADARVARVVAAPVVAQTVVDWATVKSLRPMAGWTTAPASRFTNDLGPDGMTFAVSEPGKGMRWLAAAAVPVNLAQTPYLSLRYRVSGGVSREGYVLWLGDQEGGNGGQATLALLPDDVKLDGQWHTLQVKLTAQFVAPYLAVGLDCTGAAARMTLGNLTFGSRPRSWRLAEALPSLTPIAPWPEGQTGFRAVPLAVTGAAPTLFLQRRLEVADWFAGPDIALQGVPFHVPTDPAQVGMTGTSSFADLVLKVPAGVRELYLLTAAAAPATEPWGIDPQHPKPQELLDVPEKVYYEIRYATGPPDQVLPLDLASGQWGLRRGLSVSVVHPDPRRQAVAVALCDRMETASFGVIAATAYAGAPRVREPNWERLGYPTPPARPLAKARPASARVNEPRVGAGVLQASFEWSRGLKWGSVGVSGLPTALACARGPVFEVRVSGKLLPAEDWVCQSFTANGIAGVGGRRFVLRNKTAGLLALVDCAPGKGNELRLRTQLTNESAAPLTATVHFPVLRGLTLGAPADTWYLAGKRGGVINSAPARFRDPLGERHPLQMDGFFNPKSGLALACLTHDTVAQHHFINLAKTASGGEWAPEYVDRNLAPGQTFTTTEAALVLREGDWRAIFAAYKSWLGSWFKPAVPRHRWFEESFAIASSNAHYDAAPDPKVRGDVQHLVDNYRKHLGLCDRVHLFGWGSSKTYGDWGDYNHYDEVGGLDYFRGNIQRTQDSGVAVTLYLDGYLSCGKGQAVGDRAREWAMKNPDGSPQFIKEYDAYNECPYQKDWREYLAATCARVQRETGAKILYIDEIGATDGRWICYAKDHGHNSPEIPYAGEVALAKAIREAVPPAVPLYTEYPPAEVTRQYLDGSISYQALWSADMEPLAPHFMDLPRFAFPDFKQCHIIYYVVNRAGNWWLLKFPFFNGEVYQVGEPNLASMDAPSLAFQKRAVQVQCAHRQAFASHRVEPLVKTEIAGVFANRFSGPRETAWTLYNANGRNVRGTVLRVKHMPGATYEDAWQGRKLQPRVKGGDAEIALDLGPKAIGCVVQRRP